MKKTDGLRARVAKVGGGVARGAVTAALVTSLIPASALAEAVTTSTGDTYDLAKIADGTYTGTATVADTDEGNSSDDEFDSYELTASVTVADHKITSVDVSTDPSPITDGTSQQRYDRAISGYTRRGTTYTAIPSQIVDKNGTEGLDAVTSATVTSDAIKRAVDAALVSAPEEPAGPTLTSWTDIYAEKGVDTSKGTYDVVTSATNFTSRHAGDIASIVNKVTDDAGTTTLTGVNLTGKEATVTPKLGSAEYAYSCSYGDGEFIIRPDDTVEGYTWNDFFDNAYAVTISDGTTTVGSVPWQDWYGEHSTSGYHYNKFEIAINNGTSKGSNEGNVDRYAAFYDENGNVKAGSYTVTIYSEGYEPLVASDITVKPTPATAISASAVSYASDSLTISNLPADIQNAKATVTYTTGRGRNANTTTVADAADVAADGTVALDTEKLKTLPDGIQLAVSVTSDNYADLSTTADYSVGYVYGYSGLTWAEYYASEPIDNADNASPNSQLDSHGETDLGGFDVVTRATTNHGLHRGSYQCTAVIETESGNTYDLASWNGRSEFVDTEGKTHSYSGGVIDGTDKVTGYEVRGLKYVPVAVRADQLDAYKSGHTFIENGSTLAGGFSENSIQSYTATADVDENTNGLKTVTIGDDGSVSYSAAKRDGTTSGLEGQDLQTIDLSSLNPNLRSGSDVGTYGESIRIDLAGEGYGALGAKLQSVTWTYYGSDSTYTTPEATYGTKFAADNWMHRFNGIQLGLSDSYRSPISSLSNGGVGYWKITTHALGYADASYTFEVTSDNIATHTLATDEDKAALQTLIDQADALNESDYTADSWATLQTELQETKDLVGKDTLYQAEASEQQTHLQSAIDGLAKREVTSWRDDYKAIDENIDTSASEYDVVTSATSFTSRHAGDIASIVNKATDDSGATSGLDGVKLSGKAATVTPTVSSASYSNSCRYGDGEFIIVPDDTVEGYTWNDFFDNAYAVTISDGTTTVAALPWQDWYGEHATSGYHYNKFEIAINNGTSKGSNEGQISRYASFYDENGNVKAGSYTVTIYSEGYEPLVASDITVLPTYTGEITASNVNPVEGTTTISGLPEDIQNAKATVTYTTGRGRNAKTTTYADGVSIAADGTVELDKEALASTADGTQLTVTVTSDNYQPITTTAEVKIEAYAMYRLYNPNTGEHFYTRETSERDDLIQEGWRDEGIGWYAPTTGDPVFRMYNPVAGEHHYTLSESERDHLVEVGWQYEGICWNSDPNKEVPIYREYNPNQFAWNHNFTANKEEHDWLVGLGWKDEGIAWYGVNKQD